MRVQLTERGFVKVTATYETSAKGIYAIGDVIGAPMLAHKGSASRDIDAMTIALVSRERDGLDAILRSGWEWARTPSALSWRDKSPWPLRAAPC